MQYKAMPFKTLLKPRPLLRLTRSAGGLMLILINASCSSPPPPKPAPVITPLPKTELEEAGRFEQDTLYALIAAELGLVRGKYDLGAENYLAQALKTRDVNIVERATQVTRILKRNEQSIQLAELWKELDPGSVDARFALVSEYTLNAQFDEAFNEAERLLAAGLAPEFDEIAIEAARKQSSYIPELAEKFAKALQSSPENAELLIGYSVLLQEQNKLDPSLSTIVTARELKPQSIRANYQEYRALTALKRTKEASDAYARLVALQPNNLRVRNQYARLLLSHDLQGAHDQYEILQKQSPNDADIQFNLALLKAELGKPEEAKRAFQALIDKQEYVPRSYFELAEIAKQEGNNVSALEYYKKVDSGTRYVQASSRAANIITGESGIEAALAFLDLRRENGSDDDNESLYLIEANALSAGGPKLAIEALTRGLKAYPNSVKLRYSRGLQYANLNETQLAVDDFKQVLEQVPDSAATLNALGYTMLEQTQQLSAAGKYIEKALTIEPNDAAILDSKGWYEYKRGNIDEALHYLQKAFEQYKDDEISAHLGEVLWSKGKKKRAKRVWQQGLEENAKSKVILNTIKRLDVKWP